MASVKKRPTGQWRARYRDAAGKEHARHFERRTDAQRWLDEVTTAVVTGLYVDPKAGRETVQAYAERWRATQVHRDSTAELLEIVMRRHLYPTLGARPLGSVLPTDIRSLVKSWSMTAAPSTVETRYRFVAALFLAAVADKRIPSTPCVGIKLPAKSKKQVIPLETDVVTALAAAVPDRYRALVLLGAGTGMRPGELLGLTLDRVEFLRREVRVDRQLVTKRGVGPVFGPPKTEASVRTIPIGQVVAETLAQHLERYSPGVDGLLFTNARGDATRRNAFSAMWSKAARDAGTDATAHALRHYYASLLIRHGESVKTVQRRLGHKSAVETLDTYGHLWPDADDRTREAVDIVLAAPADSLRTAVPR